MTTIQTQLFVDAYLSVDNNPDRAAIAASQADQSSDDDCIVRAALYAAHGQQSPDLIEALRSNNLNHLIRGY